jgi:hypothetical protein
MLCWQGDLLCGCCVTLCWDAAPSRRQRHSIFLPPINSTEANLNHSSAYRQALNGETDILLLYLWQQSEIL